MKHKSYMKKLILTIICTLIITYGMAQNPLDEKNGFKSIKFGMNIDSLKNKIPMTLIESHPETKTYRYEISDSEFKKVGEVSIYKITIRSFNNKVSDIFIETK